MENNKKHLKIITIFIIIILIIDQITKIMVYKNGAIIPQEENLPSNNGYYIIMTIIVIIMIIRYITNDNTFVKLDTKIILSFGIAGAVGNLIDRIWNKNVIVFIKLGESLNINLAYIYVAIAWIGMAVILTKNTMKILKEKKKN